MLDGPAEVPIIVSILDRTDISGLVEGKAGTVVHRVDRRRSVEDGFFLFDREVGIVAQGQLPDVDLLVRLALVVNTTFTYSFIY